MLIGFLTGVGIQVAMGQVAGMLGVSADAAANDPQVVTTLGKIGDTSWPRSPCRSVCSRSSLAQAINRKIPGRSSR